MPTTHIWKGDLVAIAQVDSITPANVEIGDIFKITCNGRTVQTIATAITVANVTAGLTAAWNASTQPEHAEITAADMTTYVKLTADTAGKPFTVTTSTVNGGAVDDQTLLRAAVTANQGPNVWAAGNFDSAVLPVDGDTVIIEASSVDCLYELDQNAVDLAALTIKQSYAGKLGLPRTNPGGYVEYRPQYLTINSAAAGAITINIGEGDGNGSGRIKVNTGGGQATLAIYNKGGRAETGVPCLVWKGTHASNVVNLVRGDLGVAVFSGETATIATLNVGWMTSQTSDALLVCGSGTTLSTVNAYGGTIELNSALTTLTQGAAILTLRGTGTITTWHLDGGIGFHCSNGTITTLNVGGGARVDFRQDLRARIVTNCNAYQGATIQDPNKSVTWTNGICLQRCKAEDVTLDVGEHVKLTPGAI
jgi:hypothetical protein